jgi:redox-sensing transcriptional repressor
VDKQEKQGIPSPVIYRLSIYSRCLKRLINSESERIRSEGIAMMANVKPSQVRKDLSYIAQVGTRGLGYPVETLYKAIQEIVGREQLQKVILVGAGNLGKALLRYDGFEKEGFLLVAAFDSAPDLINTEGLPCPVHPTSMMCEIIREQSIKMAILCVPAEHGQQVTNQLIHSGIIGILNFSPVTLKAPEKIMINNVDLAVELENLSYFIGK